nr:hypothetical protein [Enhydrobacter sp.]
MLDIAFARAISSSAILSTSSPAGVAAMSRRNRSKMRTPTFFSRAAMFRLSVGWRICNAAAARPKWR